MDDELELDLSEDQNINKTQERITNLSSKVKKTAEERDAARQAQEESEAARLAAEKERDFYASFSDSASKYPAAAEFKDAIKEKVLSGYSVEDATVAVLNANNKLMPTVEQAPDPGPAAGGSAANAIADIAAKSVAEMTQDERRTLLVEAEKRGDITLS